MTKKEYFMNNVPCAVLPLTFNSSYVLYGVKHGINDYVYIAYKNKGIIKSYHKLIIHYTTDCSAFVILHGRRLHIAEFCRL